MAITSEGALLCPKHGGLRALCQECRKERTMVEYTDGRGFAQAPYYAELTPEYKQKRDQWREQVAQAAQNATQDRHCGSHGGSLTVIPGQHCPGCRVAAQQVLIEEARERRAQLELQTVMMKQHPLVRVSKNEPQQIVWSEAGDFNSWEPTKEAHSHTVVDPGHSHVDWSRGAPAVGHELPEQNMRAPHTSGSTSYTVPMRPGTTNSDVNPVRPSIPWCTDEAWSPLKITAWDAGQHVWTIATAYGDRGVSIHWMRKHGFEVDLKTGAVWEERCDCQACLKAKRWKNPTFYLHSPCPVATTVKEPLPAWAMKEGV